MYDYQADKFTLYQYGSERRHNETKHKKTTKRIVCIESVICKWIILPTQNSTVAVVSK